MLYVGDVGTARSAAFEVYLKECFGDVRVADLAELATLDFDDAEVVVVDGEPVTYVDGMPRTYKVAPGLTVDSLPPPTVLVGGVGGAIADAIGLKLGWRHGCLCLDHRAIIDEGMSHPIFNGPLAVPPIATTSTPSPENFGHYAKVKDVPATVATVEIAIAAEDEDAIRAEMKRASQAGDTAAVVAAMSSLPTPGLVSTSAGFLDSPDCERICGGINMKAHDYVAVGRQGRMLQWGFEADPSRMTPLGRALFANAVAYIAAFADAPIEVLRVALPRESLAISLAFLDGGGAGRVAGLFGGAAPAGLAAATSSDEALAWFATHRDYVRHVGSGPGAHWVLDEDALTVGLAIDSLELLDHCLADPGDERSGRLWTRYTHRALTDASIERAWLAEHRTDLYFSDWAGYRWISPRDLPRLRPTEPRQTGDGPVLAALSAVADATSIRAWVTLQIAPGHHVYAPGAGDGLPVTVGLPDNSAFSLVDVTFPDTEDGHLSGYHVIGLTLGAAPVGAAGRDELTILLGVQSCDEQSCRPPTTLTLVCPVTSSD